MTITTEEVVNYLEKFPVINLPKNQIEIENPNYTIYASAPFWLPHQALCLLAGIKTIEVHTFRTCIALNNLQLIINSALAKGDSPPSGKGDFCDFIIKHFPILQSKLTFLKNLNEKLFKAIESGALPHQKEMINKLNETLLCPLTVISWLKREKITIPTKLLEALAHRDKIDMLHLPKTFPDEINPYGKWTSLRMDYNLSKPNYPVGGIPGFAFTSFPEEQVLGEKSENTTSSNELDKQILTNRAKEIYEKITKARKQCIDLYLDAQFGEDAANYSHLIDQLGIPKIEEFISYNKGGPKPELLKHRCQAIARVIRHFDEKISIKNLETNESMIQFGWRRSERVTFLVFRKWMYAEGIYDCPRSKKKN
jgi:hypothetical protein